MQIKEYLKHTAGQFKKFIFTPRDQKAAKHIHVNQGVISIEHQRGAPGLIVHNLDGPISSSTRNISLACEISKETFLKEVPHFNSVGLTAYSHSHYKNLVFLPGDITDASEGQIKTWESFQEMFNHTSPFVAQGLCSHGKDGKTYRQHLNPETMLTPEDFGKLVLKLKRLDGSSIISNSDHSKLLSEYENHYNQHKNAPNTTEVPRELTKFVISSILTTFFNTLMQAYIKPLLIRKLGEEAIEKGERAIELSKALGSLVSIVAVMVDIYTKYCLSSSLALATVLSLTSNFLLKPALIKLGLHDIYAENITLGISDFIAFLSNGEWISQFACLLGWDKTLTNLGQTLAWGVIKYLPPIGDKELHLFGFDLRDRTRGNLYNSQNNIKPRAVEYIQNLINSGHKVAIVTESWSVWLLRNQLEAAGLPREVAQSIPIKSPSTSVSQEEIAGGKPKWAVDFVKEYENEISSVYCYDDEQTFLAAFLENFHMRKGGNLKAYTYNVRSRDFFETIFPETENNQIDIEDDSQDAQMKFKT